MTVPKLGEGKGHFFTPETAPTATVARMRPVAPPWV